MSAHQDRIIAWILGIGGKSYELSCRGELVEEFTANQDVDRPIAEAIYYDFDAAADNDANGAERAGQRVYSLTAVQKDGCRETCPYKIRKVAENTAVMAKLVSDLHKVNLKRDKMALESLQAQIVSLAKENQHYRKQQVEFHAKLESLRSKELDRKIALDEHEHNKELKERITGVAIPALLACAQEFIANKGGLALPAPDIRALALSEIAKGINESQLERLGAIVPDPRFGPFLADCCDGKVDLDYFRAVVHSLNPDQAAAVFSCFNPGQQASLAALIKAL